MLSTHIRIQKLGALIADRFDGDYTTIRTNAPIIDHDVEDPFIWCDADGLAFVYNQYPSIRTQTRRRIADHKTVVFPRV